MLNFKEVEEKDLEILANLYSAFSLVLKQEDWSYESALSYIQYFYHYQPDLFICVYDDDIPIGAVMSTLKPYHDGMHLNEFEVFVSEDYREQNIENKLFEMHLELANSKYNVSNVDTIVHKNISLDYLSWFKNIGFEINSNLIILNKIV